MPLRQLLVNTHSPSFISQPDVRNALLFAYTATRVGPAAQPGMAPQRVTRMVQVEKAYLTQMHLGFEREFVGDLAKTFEDLHFIDHGSAFQVLASHNFSRY